LAVSALVSTLQPENAHYKFYCCRYLLRIIRVFYLINKNIMNEYENELTIIILIMLLKMLIYIYKKKLFNSINKGGIKKYYKI